MDRNSLKSLLVGVLALFGAGPVFAQNAYPLFAPANGILVGDPNTYVTTPATSTNIRSLWTGTCDITTWLRGDGSCALLSTTGQALTRVNDTNVTLTLGGTPTTSLLSSTSLTLGWTGLLSPIRGGTGVSALGNLTEVDDTNVTLTLGGTPTGSLINNVSVTAGWTGLLSPTRGGLGISTVTDDSVPVANGTGYASQVIPNCQDTSGNHLNYNTSTNSFSCGTSSSVSPVTGANPTATIGLTAVNGSSPNFLRSDGAPALSQAIAPTWSAQHIFSFAGTSGTPTIEMSSSQPVLLLNESDQGVDAKAWEMRPAAGVLDFRTINDARNVSSVWLSVARSSNTISSLTFGNTTNNPSYTFSGTGTTTVNGAFNTNAAAGTIRDIGYTTGGSLRWLLRTDGTAESGGNAGSNFSIRARSDAGADLGAVMFVTRSTGVTQFPLNQVQGINGSAGTPAWSFVNEANTGIYRDGTTSRINFAGNGLATGYLDVNGLAVLGQTVIADRSGNTRFQLNQSGVRKGFLHSAAGLNDFCNGTVANDLCLATASGKLVFSDDDGSTVGMQLDGGQLRVTGSGANLDLRGTASGSANVSYAQFTDSGGTRTGYVGDGSAGNGNVDLACDTSTCITSLVNNGGRTQFTGGQEVRSANDNSFYSHYNTANTTRSGYFQSTTAGFTTISHDISAGTVDIQVASGLGAVNIKPNNATTQVTWTGSGQVMAGATGGAQGSGTVNATGLFVNAVAVCQSNGTNCPSSAQTSGTFTITWDDACTTSPTTVVDYVQDGNVVTLVFRSNTGFTCTSDSVNFATTTAIVPSGIRPATSIQAKNMYTGFQNNGAAGVGCFQINSTGTVQWLFSGSYGANCGNWTNTGTKDGQITGTFTYITNDP